MLFPAMEVSNLASDDSAAAAEGVDFLSRVLAGRVTMVGLFHRQFGYSMLPTWTEPFEKAFPQPRQGEREGVGSAYESACMRVCVSARLWCFVGLAHHGHDACMAEGYLTA